MEVLGSPNGEDSTAIPSSSSFAALKEMLQQQAKFKNASGPNKLLEIMSLDMQRFRGIMKSYMSRNKDLEELVQLLKEDNDVKKQEVESWKHKYHDLQVSCVKMHILD